MAILDDYKRIHVIKVGSGCIVSDQGRLKANNLEKIASDVSSLGEPVIMVVSGAVALGKRCMKDKRKSSEIQDVSTLQMYAMIGQPELMHAYKEHFSKFHLTTAECLITREQLVRPQAALNGIYECLRNSVVPLVNHNDGTDASETRLDNDVPAAQLLLDCGGERLVIIGDSYEGFMKNGSLVQSLGNLKEIRKAYTHCNGNSKNGTGGMRTKISAAELIMKSDLEARKVYSGHESREVILGNVKYPLNGLISGSSPRTLFKLL